MAMASPLTHDFGQHHFGHAQLGHRRRTRSLVDLANRLAQHPGGSLPEKFHDPNALRRCYDLMNTPTVTHAAVLDPHRQSTFAAAHACADTILFLHDTTEFDFTTRTTLHDDLGQIGNGRGQGYLCHNSLAVTAAGAVLGLAHQLLHCRPVVPKNETHAQKRARETRETLLWVHGVQALEAPPAGRRWVDVCDRGGDTFEFLDEEPYRGRQYVVRSKHNRRIQVGHDGQGRVTLLHTHLQTLASQGQRRVTVHDHDTGAAREALVQVSWAPVRLLLPQNRRGCYRARYLDVWAVRVWEVNPPAGAEAVEWFLVTNVAVTAVADAWERVDWYLKRWVVEEYHKAQKTGCALEGPQFETVEALQPMIALLSVVALVLLNLRDLSRRAQSATEPARQVVAAAYVEVLSAWRGQGGRELTVREFVQALGRLGGHQNRRGDGAPGWLVLWRGWRKLQLLVDGYRAGRRAERQTRKADHNKDIPDG